MIRRETYIPAPMSAADRLALKLAVLVAVLGVILCAAIVGMLKLGGVS